MAAAKSSEEVVVADGRHKQSKGATAASGVMSAKPSKPSRNAKDEKRQPVRSRSRSRFRSRSPPKKIDSAKVDAGKSDGARDRSRSRGRDAAHLTGNTSGGGGGGSVSVGGNHAITFGVLGFNVLDGWTIPCGVLAPTRINSALKDQPVYDAVVSDVEDGRVCLRVEPKIRVTWDLATNGLVVESVRFKNSAEKEFEIPKHALKPATEIDWNKPNEPQELKLTRLWSDDGNANSLATATIRVVSKPNQTARLIVLDFISLTADCRSA